MATVSQSVFDDFKASAQAAIQTYAADLLKLNSEVYGTEGDAGKEGITKAVWRHQQYMEDDLQFMQKTMEERVFEIERVVLKMQKEIADKRDVIESRTVSALEALASSARSGDNGVSTASERHSVETLPSKRSMVLLKNMTPDKLVKESDWRRWREQVEDYAEECFSGMKKKLEEVRR